MLTKLSKYTFEIIAGIVIFVAILYFLPSNKVDIPDVGELRLETVELAFVMEEEISDEGGMIHNDDEEGEIIDEELETIDEEIEEVDFTIEEEADAIVADILETGYFTQEPPMDISIDSSLLVSGKDTDTSSQELEARSYNSCITPWNTRINHGDSVLAYQQRSDDPGVCNVQRRVCDDGVLGGSFTQSSCRELLGFDTQRQEVVSYNNPSIDPLIQPQSPSTPNISSSQFIPRTPSGTQSSRNPHIPSTTQGQTSVFNPNRDVRTSGTTWDGTTCMTPRGEEVRNGQFVKAYKLDKGFSNLPCEVELRYCVQTNLEGTFMYPSCQHYDIAVEDYMIGHYDPDSPSLQHLVEILHGSADDIPDNYGQQPTFWQKVQGFFQRLF